MEKGALSCSLVGGGHLLSISLPSLLPQLHKDAGVMLQPFSKKLEYEEKLGWPHGEGMVRWGSVSKPGSAFILVLASCFAYSFNFFIFNFLLFFLQWFDRKRGQ